jgi:uncharacterized membrane protein YbhN (UPF0104 family)
MWDLIRATERRIPWYARWLLAAAVLAAVLAYLDLESILRSLGGVDWQLALPGIALLCATHVVSALAWRAITAQVTGQVIPIRFALRSYFGSQAIGGFTPANIGGDIYRARDLHSPDTGWKQAFLPVVVQRVGSYGSLAAAGFVATFLIPVSETIRLVLAAVAALAVLAAAAAWWRTSRTGTLARPRRPLAGPIATALVTGLVFHATAIASTYVLVRSVSESGDMLPVLAALAIGRVATLVPLTPNGIGVQEAATAAVLTSVGVSGEEALVAVALARLATLVTMTMGFVLIVAQRFSSGAGELRATAGDHAART